MTSTRWPGEAPVGGWEYQERSGWSRCSSQLPRKRTPNGHPRPDGTLQNNPVGLRYNPETATIDARGLNMGATRKFGNFEADGRVAFVVDDIASVSPWRVRGIEIRGRGPALTQPARASPAPTPGNSTGCPA